jgi:glutathione S-transferase
LPHWINLMEKRIEKWGRGYAVGSNLTIADLKIAVLFGSFMRADIPYLAGLNVSSKIRNSPRLFSIIQKVENNPKVREWNKTVNKFEKSY